MLGTHTDIILMLNGVKEASQLLDMVLGGRDLLTQLL